MSPHALRLGLEELYAEYASCLDDAELERWPDFFTADCQYRIVPRENFDRGLPLAILSCESRGGLRDRVRAVRETAVFAPRSLRHLVRDAGRLRFAEKICVFDSVLVPGSLVYPI